MRIAIEALVSAVALSICTGASAVEETVDCVPEGGSVNVYWPAVVDWNPYPRDLEFVSAEAYEHDSLTPNESAGPAAIVPAATPDADPQICLEIRNYDGFLFGPNSETLNYFGEGKCIEVFAEVEFRYAVKHCTARKASIAIPGMSSGGSITVCYDAWSVATVRTKVKEVCPCD